MSFVNYPLFESYYQEGLNMTIDIQEEVRVIKCKCGCWEELPIDSPRNHTHTFDWVEDAENGEAIYLCPDCGEIVISKTMEID